MSAAGPAEATVGMLSTTDILHEGELGMYLIHMQTELQEQRAVCQGPERKQRAEELNLKPESHSEWLSAEPENTHRSLVS